MSRGRGTLDTVERRGALRCGGYAQRAPVLLVDDVHAAIAVEPALSACGPLPALPLHASAPSSASAAIRP